MRDEGTPKDVYGEATQSLGTRWEPGDEVHLQSVCTVVLMSYLVNMSSDVMWYASQSGHAIYRGSRGIGLEKNLRCSLVFEQNLQV